MGCADEIKKARILNDKDFALFEKNQEDWLP